MHVIYKNVRGLRTKLDFFRNSVYNCNSDVIFLSETWLNSCISNNELGICNYNIFRSDRSTDNFVRGGGVSLAVCNTYKCELIPTDDIPNIEHVFVLLIVGNTKFILCCVYIPPNSPYHIYAQFCELVENTIHLHPNTNILLIGDFNLSNYTSPSY